LDVSETVDRIYYMIASLIACWQVKLAVGIVLSTIDFLMGPVDAAFMALWLLIVIDPLTRWMAIAKQALVDANSCGGLLCGFKLALQSGAINSLSMRQKFIPKILGYLLVLIAASLLTKVLPQVSYSDKLLSEIPKNLIISYLAVNEFISICENLSVSGLTALRPIAKFFTTKRDDLLK